MKPNLHAAGICDCCDDPREYRELVCTSCAEVIGVFELPREWIDPDRYRCGRCLQRTPIDTQLTLAGNRAGRRETPRYDPEQSTIPF